MTKAEIYIARDAYVNGCNEALGVSRSACADAAKRRYPLPTKPREVSLRGVYYRVVNGKLEYRHVDETKWSPSAHSLDYLREEGRNIDLLLYAPTESDE